MLYVCKYNQQLWMYVYGQFTKLQRLPFFFLSSRMPRLFWLRWVNSKTILYLQQTIYKRRISYSFRSIEETKSRTINAANGYIQKTISYSSQLATFSRELSVWRLYSSQ